MNDLSINIIYSTITINNNCSKTCKNQFTDYILFDKNLRYYYNTLVLYSYHK